MSESELVSLTIVPNEAEAEMIRGLLATEGIESMQRKTDFAAGAWAGSPTGGPHEILVYAGDLERARGLIADQ